MEKNKIKDALKKSYAILRPFSDKYRGDFQRFLYSLDLLGSKGNIRNKKILDIGSGIGIIAVALKNLGAEVVGADKFIFPDESENFYTISDFDRLKRIWEECGFKVLKTDVAKERMPFEDGYFDIVICDAAIEHLDESPKTLFQGIHRVLKNEGIFMVSTPNFATLLKRLRFLFGRSPNWDIKNYFESGANFKGHRREFTVSEIIQMLEWSSFEIVKRNTKNIFLNPKKLLTGRRAVSQFCSILSYPIFSMREMIYVIARKK